MFWKCYLLVAKRTIREHCFLVIHKKQLATFWECYIVVPEKETKPNQKLTSGKFSVFAGIMFYLKC